MEEPVEEYDSLEDDGELIIGGEPEAIFKYGIIFGAVYVVMVLLVAHYYVAPWIISRF